ncbi:hypothetical protein GCM10010344_70180 [Streptomyces bluensis]|nr:hypothetical protein GCM10010344_70180 [Streptomyces bluensis]
MRVSPKIGTAVRAPCGEGGPPAYCVREGTSPFTASRGSQTGRRRPNGYALRCENSFSTGTPTLCRARDAQSWWKNSST